MTFVQALSTKHVLKIWIYYIFLTLLFSAPRFCVPCLYTLVVCRDRYASNIKLHDTGYLSSTRLSYIRPTPRRHLQHLLCEYAWNDIADIPPRPVSFSRQHSSQVCRYSTLEMYILYLYINLWVPSDPIMSTHRQDVPRHVDNRESLDVLNRVGRMSCPLSRPKGGVFGKSSTT